MTENIQPPVVENVAPTTPVAEAPKVEAAPVVNSESVKVETPAPEAVKTEVPKEATTVLGAEPEVKAETPKESEAPKTETKTEGQEAEVKKDESKQSEEPAPLPTYEAFALPEGITFEDDKLNEFTKDLAEFETLTKADHAETQKLGQKLVDRHIAEVQNTITRLNEHYTNAWEKQKNDWKESFVKDPEIGGNRQDTTVKAALEFIRTHGGNETQQKEFRDLMETTGIGNHPAMIRMLAKANMNLAEGKPLPGTKPVPEANSKVQKRYGNI